MTRLTAEPDLAVFSPTHATFLICRTTYGQASAICRATGARVSVAEFLQFQNPKPVPDSRGAAGP